MRVTLSLCDSGLLAAHGGHPEFVDYINKLIYDDRGGRQGFPTEVLDDKLFLHRLHVTRHGQPHVREFEPTTWR